MELIQKGIYECKQESFIIKRVGRLVLGTITRRVECPLERVPTYVQTYIYTYRNRLGRRQGDGGGEQEAVGVESQQRSIRVWLRHNTRQETTLLVTHRRPNRNVPPFNNNRPR